MSSALVINCSHTYNLGAAKLADWLADEGYEVTACTGDPGPIFTTGFDLVALSCVFSWDVPTARAIALRVKPHSDVWAGGPGFAALPKWWERETGLSCTTGLDQRFERQWGGYKMTFAARGCPVGCWFCIVPKIEGKEFTLDWDFNPAPMLCDNNLSALPVEFQQHIIRRYQETGVPLKDANSGFEPRTFDRETYARWRPILKGPWRFAYDDLQETGDVRRMMALLQEEPPGRKRVYVLVGNEPFEACYERAQRVIEWGGEPHCQPVMKLNALTKQDLIVRHDWTAHHLRHFARFYNRHIYRYAGLEEYRNSKNEPAPFADWLARARGGQEAKATV